MSDYTTIFMHSPVLRHCVIYCFWLLLLGNICVQVFVINDDFHFFGYRVGIRLTTWETTKLLFLQSGIPFFKSASNVREFLVASNPFPLWVWSVFNISHSIVGESLCGGKVHFSVISDAEHFLMCSLSLVCLPLVVCVFKHFVHFKIWLFIFLLLTGKSYLYLLCTCPLSDMFCKYFFTEMWPDFLFLLLRLFNCVWSLDGI